MKYNHTWLVPIMAHCNTNTIPMQMPIRCRVLAKCRTIEIAKCTLQMQYEQGTHSHTRPAKSCVRSGVALGPDWKSCGPRFFGSLPVVKCWRRRLEVERCLFCPMVTKLGQMCPKVCQASAKLDQHRALSGRTHLTLCGRHWST